MIYGNKLSHSALQLGARMDNLESIPKSLDFVQDIGPPVRGSNMTAPRRTPPRKLNIGDMVSPTATSNHHHHHHSQGIAALFAITFDLRVHTTQFLGVSNLDIGWVYHNMATARGYY